MILHACQGLRGTVYDLDTGLRVPKVISFDPERGEVEAYEVNERDEIATDGEGNQLTYRAKGRFRFVPRSSLARSSSARDPLARRVKRIVMGAPKCAKCSNLLTLPGEDLCAACDAADKGRRRPRMERIIDPLAARPCEHPRCGRLAEWQVSDEVEATPQLAAAPDLRGFGERRRGRALYLRAATVGRRSYCSRHYQPPRLLDAKGEVVERFEDSARPS